MMNYTNFLSQPSEQRAGVFIEGANAKRTSPSNIEKDFWICFVLDALFTYRRKTWPQMLFRGGTSLSKAFGLIDRFSEDIDVSIDRTKFMQDSLRALETMDDAARQERLEDLSERAATFVQTEVVPHLTAHFRRNIGNAEDVPRIVASETDPLTVEIPYRRLTGDRDGYVRSIVRLEFSIRAASTPTTNKSVTPYISQVLPSAEMMIAKVPAITAHRTFWDKFLIAHEIKNRFDHLENPVRADERVSRHYYDLYKLITSKTVGVSERQLRLARNCQRHSSLFYPTPGLDISEALPGTFAVVPDEQMIKWLERDYAQMSVMVFGTAPKFDTIVTELRKFQSRVNGFEALRMSRQGAG